MTGGFGGGGCYCCYGWFSIIQYYCIIEQCSSAVPKRNQYWGGVGSVVSAGDVVVCIGWWHLHGGHDTLVAFQSRTVDAVPLSHIHMGIERGKQRHWVGRSTTTTTTMTDGDASCSCHGRRICAKRKKMGIDN
jgi:hypothetical protein